MGEDDPSHSPHYIPELDPENPESGPKVKQRMLWLLVIAGAVFLIAGAASYLSGRQELGLILAAIGLILLAPFWVFIGG